MTPVDVRISRPLAKPDWRPRSHSIELNQARFEGPTEPILIEDQRSSWSVSCPHTALALPDGSVQSVEVRGVLEVVRDDRTLFKELARIVAPGGRIRICVPNAGLVAGFDSVNLYRYVADTTHRGIWIPEVTEVGFRRHYSERDLTTALTDTFVVERSWTTGTVLPELAQISALLGLTLVQQMADRFLRARPWLQRMSQIDRAIPVPLVGYWRWIEVRKAR
jgi:SAM-dependent methyltransferase